MFRLPMSFLMRSLLFFSFFIVISGLSKWEVLANSKGIKEKNITISGLILPPASGKKPDSMVVLFHGYGDIGENFLFLGAFLGQLLPDTLFVAPDGPIDCKTIPSGKQWLSVQSKSNRAQLLKEIKNLTPYLNRYVDDLLKTYDIPPEKMAFLGFSQGARVALHIGLRRPCAGIVAMSGSYLDDPLAKNLSRPPILITHGEKDQKAPLSLGEESFKQLDALKMPVTFISLPGIDHEIDPQGLAIAGKFLKDCFSGKVVDKR